MREPYKAGIQTLSANPPTLRRRPVLVAGSETKGKKLRFEAAASTDTGRVRDSNQDCFGYKLDDGIFVVCDGMGGAAAGDVASRTSVDVFLHEATTESVHTGDTDPGLITIHADPSPFSSHPSDPAALLRHAISEANLAVYSLAQDDMTMRGMGTTLVALLLQEGRGWTAHVGDSRCYRMRDGALERLTADHSLVDEQVRLGQITAEEAERSPLRNVITRAIGSHGSVEAEVNQIDVRTGDILLLCSDGLIREVTDRQIGDVLRSAVSLQHACDELIDAANRSGGKDNVTCLLVRAL